MALATAVENRRHDVRRETRIAVSALYPGFWELDDLDPLRGWTFDLSANGLCFVIPHELTTREIVLHLALPGTGYTYVLGEIVGFRECPDDGLWQYHVQFQEIMLGSSDPTSL